MSSGGSIISTLGSNTLSLQNTKGNSAKVDSQKLQGAEAEITKTSDTDTVSTENINNRSTALSGILDGISQSLQTIEHSQASISKLNSLLRKGLEVAQGAQAKATPPDVAALASLRAQFSEILRQVSQAADEAGSGGTNLLKGGSVETSFGENARNNIETTGIDATPNGLGIDEPPFSSVENIAATIGQVVNALKTTDSFEKQLNEDADLIRTRQDFTKETLGTIENANESADTSEGANLLALKIGQQLRELDTSLASRDQQDLLKLF